MDTTQEIKPPPFVRVCRLIVSEWGAQRVDNFTGRLVHDKKVERALAAKGLDLYPELDETPEDEAKREEPIAIKRKRGGPKINPVLVDAFTASMVCQVWDAINDTNRAKLPGLIAKLHVTGVVNCFWKLVRK